MREHLGEHGAAGLNMQAVERVLTRAEGLMPDPGGPGSMESIAAILQGNCNWACHYCVAPFHWLCG